MDVQLVRSDKSDAASNEEAHAALRVTLTSRDPSRLGRLLSAKAVEIGLATIPGNVGRGGGGFSGGQTIVHWPALIDSRRVVERVHVSGMDVIEVMPTQRLDLPDVGVQVPPPVLTRAPAGPVASVPIDRYEMPNLRALNFLVRGVLAGGASSNNRLDRQAKSLGEYLGTRMIEVPVSLVPSSATV